MQLFGQLRAALCKWIVSALIFYASCCYAQPTHLARHYGLFNESAKIKLLSKIDKTLSDTAATVATATADIATMVDRQTNITTTMQNEVQQLTHIVGRILNKMELGDNISAFATSNASGGDGWLQTIQALTEASSNISLRIEKLQDIYNITLRKAEAESQARESRMFSNLTTILRQANERQNESTLCTRTDELSSQNSESFAIVRKLPDILKTAIEAAYVNASTNLDRAYESRVFANIAAVLQGAYKQQNDSTLCARMDELLSQNDESLAILRGLPEFINEAIRTVLVNSSANLHAAYENRILSNLITILRGMHERQNESMLSAMTNVLLSQNNQSLSILRGLPEFLRTSIGAAYVNVSASLDRALYSFCRFNGAFNHSTGSMTDVSVNYTQEIVTILSLFTSTATDRNQSIERMSSILHQNEQLLQKVERIFSLFGNSSNEMLHVQKYGSTATNVSEAASFSREDVCYPYDEARRTITIKEWYIRAQSNRILAELQAISDYFSPAAKTLVPGSRTYRGCQDAFRQGERKPAVYNIYINETIAFRAWCDFDSRGGWTVMQRRYDGSVDFFKPWRDYQMGFGNLWGEHWLGLDKVNYLTRNASVLSIYLEVSGDMPVWANYSSFQIGDMTSQYRLSIAGYHGTAGDSFIHSNEHRFTTWDRDNDMYIHGNCALNSFGAWWYAQGCFYSNLNGRYERECASKVFSPQWSTLNTCLGLKTTVMRLLV